MDLCQTVCVSFGSAATVQVLAFEKVKYRLFKSMQAFRDFPRLLGFFEEVSSYINGSQDLLQHFCFAMKFRKMCCGTEKLLRTFLSA